MLQMCHLCNQPFEKDDVIRAVVISKYVPLKSTVAYAMEKPTDCESIEHKNCQFPKTGELQGD